MLGICSKCYLCTKQIRVTVKVPLVSTCNSVNLDFQCLSAIFFLYNAIGDWLLFLLCAVVRTVCLQGKKTFPEFIPPPPFFPLNFSFEFHVRAVLSTLPMLCNKLRYEAAWGELLFLQGTLPLVAFLCGWKKKKKSREQYFLISFLELECYFSS